MLHAAIRSTAGSPRPWLAIGARESHGHVLAEPVDSVDRPGGVDQVDGKACPLGKLIGEQPTHERYVGVDLVDMHLRSAHSYS